MRDSGRAIPVLFDSVPAIRFQDQNNANFVRHFLPSFIISLKAIRAFDPISVDFDSNSTLNIMLLRHIVDRLASRDH